MSQTIELDRIKAVAERMRKSGEEIEKTARRHPPSNFHHRLGMARARDYQRFVNELRALETPADG